EPGGLALGGRDRPVAEAAAATLRDDVLRALAHEVREDLALGRLHHGAVGHAQDQVLARGALAVVAHTHAATVRATVRGVVELEERRDLRVDDEDDAAAVAAGAAVGTGERL